MFLIALLLGCNAPDATVVVGSADANDTAVVLPEGVVLEDGPVIQPDKRLTVTLDQASGVWAACEMVGDPEEVLVVESLDEKDVHELKLLGLAAGEDYTCTVTSLAGEVFTVPVSVKPVQYAPEFTVERDWDKQMSGVWTLFNDADGCFMGTRSHAIIVDPEGRLRWVYEVGTNYVTDLDIELTKDGNIHIGGGWGILDSQQPNRGVFRDVDFEGNTVLERDYPDFGIGWNHHSEPMDDGSYLSLTTHVLDDGVNAWYGAAVERWHPDSGLTWTWDTTGMLDAGQLAYIEGEYAPYHPNSVTWMDDADGEALFVSNYAEQSIWRIDRTTGLRTWKLGQGGDFALQDTDGNPLSDREWFHVQHDPEYTNNGRNILVYDNGYERPDGPDYSRVAEYEIDPDNGIATLLWTWTEDGWYNPVIGDADWLDNGNVLITRGFMKCWSWYSDDVSQLNEIDPEDGSLIWRLEWPDQDRTVFRSERYDGCEMFANNTKYCPEAQTRLTELMAL